MVTAPVRREVVREMVARGLSERRALTVGQMSASAFRYGPRLDGHAVVRDRIVDLAQRHRRDGAGMISLKLRQAGHVINHTRVDRLYTEARLQLKRRRRKTIPRADRQPLVRPERRNQVWSADFVFDRTADGRVMKCLTMVDDATHEAVAIVPARAFGDCRSPASWTAWRSPADFRRFSARTTGRSSVVARCSHGRTRRG